MNNIEIENKLIEVLDPNGKAYKDASVNLSKIPPQYHENILNALLADSLSKELISQPEFAKGHGYSIWLGDSGTGLTPVMAAQVLIRRTSRTSDPKEAVDWLNRVLATKEADGKIILALWGILVEQPIHFNEELSLIAFSDVTPSHNKKVILDSASTYPIGVFQPFPFRSPSAALTAKIHVNPFIQPSELAGLPPQGPLPQHEMLELARLSLNCVGTATAIAAASWFQFDDPDIQDAVLFSGISTRIGLKHDILFIKDSNIEIEEAQKVVRSVLRLSGDVAKRTKISLQRFDRACRHFDLNDKALDLAIALESLLTEDAGENNFKVGLRAALLSADNPKEQIRARYLVNGLYKIRNKVVHRGYALKEVTIKEKKIPTSEVINESVKIVAQVIKTIAEKGIIPDWHEYELE
ncbi:MAG: hypothetical protein V1799_20590 [bacterium]